MVQMVAGILAFVLMDTVEKAMMDYMQHAITHYGDNDDIRDAIDFLQKQVNLLPTPHNPPPPLHTHV